MKVRNFERFSLKTLRCKTRVVPANAWSAIFIAAEYAHAHYSRSRGGKRPFCFSSGEKTSEVISMPPSKVCPQCETID